MNGNRRSRGETVLVDLQALEKASSEQKRYWSKTTEGEIRSVSNPSKKFS